MTETDMELLRLFVRDQSQDAFTEIVRRHLDMVYCAALRQVRSHPLAEEITQSVFNDFAQAAPRLKKETIPAAWLYEVTRRTALNTLRDEIRRHHREQAAAQLNTVNSTTSDWNHIEPILDEAMHSLDSTDRAAILLRYFENRSLKDVGAALGTSDDAAQKRVTRAVERLREFLSKRGLAIGTSALVMAVSTQAAQAAPQMISSVIAAKATTSATSNLASATKTLSQTILMTSKAKSLVSVIALVLFIGVGVVAVKHHAANSPAAKAVAVDLDKYTGQFEMPGHILIITKKGKGISVGGTDGGVPFVAYPQSETEFLSHDQGSITKITFTRDASRQAIQLSLVRDGHLLGELKRSEPQ